MSKRRITLTRVPRKRLEAAIAVHEGIVGKHPPSSETYQYSKESLTKLRAELARRDRARQPNRREVPSVAKKRGRRRRVSGCYVIGSARRRRRKANPRKARKRPVPCYAIGRARIRRRKMNRTAATRTRYALCAYRAGRRLLKYVGHSKFSDKGRPVLFNGRSEANAVAWVLRNSFPAALRGYRLTAEPHP
jgi:hypothetical protein